MKVKKLIAAGLTAAMFMSGLSICSDAASYKVKEKKVGAHYEYYYMTVSTAKEYKKGSTLRAS